MTVRVLMLGWEFPPFISGGLGTACYGLTKALNRRGVDVLFVLPKSVDVQYATHVRIMGPREDEKSEVRNQRSEVRPDSIAAGGGPRFPGSVLAQSQTYQLPEFEHVTFRTVPSTIVSPYHLHESPKGYAELLARSGVPRPASLGRGGSPPQDPGAPQKPGEDYDGDIVTQSRRYAELCSVLTRGEEFDVVHAHDWMTYPAGLKIAAATGRPLVVHVHSTEYDRAGEHGNRAIYDIERSGMHGAMKVVCVSYLTRNVCLKRYGVPPERVEVCYNGIESNGPNGNGPRDPIRKGDKIVLFLGRVTMQKGPEYFIGAAKKVVSKIENVKFVVAGSGDMVPQVMRLAREMGIAHKVVFTGFLRAPDVERVLRMADVYVMPSVSEPFGIAPLEAIRHDVPVIISRNSGVAEVVKHALKVDFWDTDDIADKVIAVLRHPPLSQTLREQADIEVRSLTWDGAASRCVQVYEKAIDGVGELARA